VQHDERVVEEWWKSELKKRERRKETFAREEGRSIARLVEVEGSGRLRLEVGVL